MSYEDKILDYLAKPENLFLSFQVAEYVQALKEKYHEGFWPLFSKRLKDVLDTSDLNEKWSLVPLANSDWKKNWGKCYLRPSDQSAQKNFVQMVFGQGTKSNHFRFFHGVLWYEREPDGYTSPACDELTQKMVERNINVEEARWIRWDYLPLSAQTEEFISRMHNEPDAVVDELVQEFWKLFEDLSPQMEAINSDLLK